MSEMNEPTDLTMSENDFRESNLKRTHEEAGLGPTGSNLMRQAYSDDEFDSGDGGRSTPVPKPGKKTRGRVKINMEFIDNKLRRYTTFSKRKSGIMKKAHELATLTGTQVMLLVASETGHVYTFATRKLQPILSSEAGKQLIQTCLNSPDPPESAVTQNKYDELRMSAQGFEEPDLSYAPPEETKEGLLQKTYHNMLHTISAHSGATTQEQITTATNIHNIAEEKTNESPMNLISVNNSNSNATKGQVQAIHIPGGTYIMSGPQPQTRTIQLPSGSPQVVRASVANTSGVLAQQGLFLQPASLVPERVNDGQITLLSPYSTIQRPAMQQVVWTPTLHTQQITVVHPPSQPEEKKNDPKG